MPLACRFFVQAPSPEEAKSHCDGFQRKIEALCPGRWRADLPEPYWKQERTFEAAMEREEPPNEVDLDLLKALTSALGGSWRWSPGGRSAVFAATDARAFPSPGVSWIELELTEP